MVNKRVGDKNRHILIVDINIAEITYVLVNIYNGNAKVEQVQALSKLRELMKNITFLEENGIVLAGDLNVFAGNKLEMKEKHASKYLELEEDYDLCDIWRIQTPTKISYTFWNNDSSDIINRRLDYIFIPNKLQ